MTTFVLYADESRRVALGSELPPKTIPLREIEASHWGEAREQVAEHEFERRPGHGWFHP